MTGQIMLSTGSGPIRSIMKKKMRSTPMCWSLEVHSRLPCCYSAAKRGARVAVVDKASVSVAVRGRRVDHWHLACTNPASRITPEEMVEVLRKSFSDYSYGEFGAG